MFIGKCIALLRNRTVAHDPAWVSYRTYYRKSPPNILTLFPSLCVFTLASSPLLSCVVQHSPYFPLSPSAFPLSSFPAYLLHSSPDVLDEDLPDVFTLA